MPSECPAHIEADPAIADPPSLDSRPAAGFAFAAYRKCFVHTAIETEFSLTITCCQKTEVVIPVDPTTLTCTVVRLLIFLSQLLYPPLVWYSGVALLVPYIGLFGFCTFREIVCESVPLFANVKKERERNVFKAKLTSF